MLDLAQLLRVRSAYAGRFDAGGDRLLAIADLAGVPQVWGVREGEWPELVVAPPDRAQTIHPGPRPGQLVVGADVGGDERTQLLYVPEPGAVWRSLTADPDHIHQFGSWSADGARIAYAANLRDERWFDLFVRDLDSGETRAVLVDDSTNRAGPFSPDGRRLVCTRVFSNAHQQLWLVDLDGAEPPRLLTTAAAPARYEQPEWTPDGSAIVCLCDLDRELAAPARVDVATGRVDYLVEPDREVDECTLSPDGRLLAYAVNDGANEVVVRDLAEDGRRWTVAGLPPGALYAYWQPALAWDAAGRRLAISWTASRFGPNVWVFDLGTQGEARQVTRAPMAGIEPAMLFEPEHVRYPTFDGREIPALYYAAPGGHPARPEGRAGDPGSPAAPPCVVVVHGGPEGQYRPTFQPVVQYLVSAGFAVLAPNVRGSSGYGKTYLHLDDVRLRMDSVADLAHAARWLRDSGRAHPERIAVYGGSYGGFMVLAALTTDPQLWAAGVDLVGIANFVTFLERTGPWRRHLREAEYGSLEHDRDFLEAISPINHVDRIRAPLLVIHGANDPRVPIGETEQMVERLRALGRPVEFIRLDDEGHQIAKLANKLLAYPAAVGFLQATLR
jgi:dipeptidyl aminopeptidase/acylaminoacyl peptidase